MKKLDFYFDYVSNNAYLAWTQLNSLAEKLNLEVDPKPILFAGLLNAHSNVGPAEIAAKREWMSKNILRKCAELKVPISPPVHHPFNPLLALRASSMELSRQERWSLIDGLFKAVWVDGLHITEPEIVASVASNAGLDTGTVLKWAQSPEASNALRQQTEQAVDQGVFGIPSMIIEGELFFGFDDFPFLEQFVKGKDPLSQDVLAGWSPTLISPSSVRSTND